VEIICSSCGKVLGIQRPYNDNSEISAKCPDCFQEEKEEASKRPSLPAPGERKDITFENGLKGFLTVAGADTVKLSLYDLMVSGKKIFCTKDRREGFQEYLEMREDDHVDVTFVYSFSTKIPPADRKMKKQPTIYYNCTVTVSKNYALMMFDKVAAQQARFMNAIIEGLAKEWKEECLRWSSKERFLTNGF
jgi:hypothetical protein